MRKILNTRFVILPILAAAMLTTACEGDATGPTPDLRVQALEVYSGPIDPMGTSTYLFSIDRPSTVQIMFAGAVVDNPLRSISPVLRVRLSQWNGAECVTVHEIDTAPRLTAVLHRQLDPGTYCASVVDVGALTEPTGLVLRIVAPVLLGTGGTPGTETFASTITPGGASSRTFEASAAGIVQLTFASLTPNTGEMGFGLGLLAVDGSGCKLAHIVRTVAGPAPQISMRVDAGDYCVGLFDVGNITAHQAFSVKIDHP